MVRRTVSVLVSAHVPSWIKAKELDRIQQIIMTISVERCHTQPASQTRARECGIQKLREKVDRGF